MSKHIPVARALKAGLSSPAAILLESVSFYWPKARIEKNGRRWLVFSREQWRENTGLSEWKYRVALSELRAANVLIIERHLWKGLTTNFMALDFDRFERWEKTSHRKVRKPPIGTGGNLIDHKYLKERKISKRKNYQEGCSADAFAKPLTANDNEQVEVEAEPKWPANSEPEKKSMNVSEVKEKLEASITARMAEAKAPKADGGSKISVLHADWRALVGSANNVISPKMSGADIGCLKRLIAVSPEGKAREILSQVAQKWEDFTYLLTTEFGAYKLPKTPMLWVISKFADQAVTFWKQQKAETAKAALKAAVPMQSFVPKPKLDPADLDRWTREEFEALYLENVGPRVAGDEAKYEGLWAARAPIIKKQIQTAWSMAQGQGKTYLGPRAPLQSAADTAQVA